MGNCHLEKSKSSKASLKAVGPLSSRNPRFVAKVSQKTHPKSHGEIRVSAPCFEGTTLALQNAQQQKNTSTHPNHPTSTSIHYTTPIILPKKKPPSVPPDPEQGRQRRTKDVQTKHAAFFTDAIRIQCCQVDTQKARHTGGNVILPQAKMGDGPRGDGGRRLFFFCKRGGWVLGDVSGDRFFRKCLETWDKHGSCFTPKKIPTCQEV